MLNQLTIIGVGLIGGSLSLALKKAGYCKKIVGLGRDMQRLQAACQAGIIDAGTTDYRQGLQNADMAFISVPLNSYAVVFGAMRDCLPAHTIVTDAGSAKGCVVEDARDVFGEVPARLVPGHPIAGNEKSGFEAATASLFERRRVILTPLPDTSGDAVASVTAMWRAAGAQVDEVDVAMHDRILAATSHLPHMLAFGLVDSLAQQDDVDDIFRFAAGGFRDFTRIAASDPVMWRDICLRNRDAVLAALTNYTNDLAQMRAAVEQGDGEALQKIFARAKAARDRFNY